MTERLNSYPLIFESLEPETFHTLAYTQQLSVLQTSARRLSKGSHMNQLAPADVDVEELKIVSHLIQSEFLRSFASAPKEGYMQSLNYLPKNVTTAEIEFHRIAHQKRLWEKYVGIYQHDRHLLGEVVHSLEIIFNAYFPNSTEPMMAPGNVAPAYAEAINGRIFNNSLFVGAFSPKSVQDIWAIKTHLLHGAPLTIIDPKGFLMPVAAKHYNIPVVRRDILSSGFEDNSFDLLMTNYLCGSIDTTTHNKEGLEGQHLSREKLFSELFRICSPGGKIALVEIPLVDGNSSKDIYKQINLDRKRIEENLIDVGFKNISISPVPIFGRRVLSEAFAYLGIINPKKVVTYPDINFLAVASK